MLRIVVVLVVVGAAAVALGQPGLAAFPGEGQARILNENRLSARERALSEALNRVIERAVETLVAPELREAHRGAAHALAPRARALVSSYRVLRESESGETYQLEIEGMIDPQVLRKALEAQPRGAGRAVIGEAAVALECGAPWAEAAVRLALRDVGFNLAQAGAIRVRVSAQVIEEGEVRGTELVAVRVELRAEAGPGVPRALAATARDFAPDAAAAQRSALLTSAAQLAHALREGLRPAGISPAGVAVRLVGPFGFRAMQSFAAALAAVPGVEDVTPRRFGHGWVILLARTAARPAEIAARIARLTVPGLSITIEPGAELRVRLEGASSAESQGGP
jgi:hypothetical protein